ncbi:SWI/SNF-related matrix-associated actin-dependent regulator of chromatin subfamily A [Paragonimus westermani]|uniref:DNA helicase n=1 Tax=Paragonimus westermani TaxID=34504 RepID=A0A5J4NNW0_9TREM|nr:SWI/SNF-related matrix-associated actin-dependent regulator of chromatin subfamily A [Paragonimus westermani]
MISLTQSFWNSRHRIDQDWASSPKTAEFIALLAYNSDGLTPSDDSGLDSLATLPVGGPLPSTSGSVSADSNEKSLASVSTVPVPQPYLRPMGRTRGRGRGRYNPIPLDDVMEKKIMTFEGRDCVQHLDELQRLFPRFKRAYINRIFTRNMLNYDKTFQQLNEQNNIEVAKCASVRLVQANKPDPKRTGPKPKGEIIPLNPQSYLYLDVPLGRCPPHIASTLYRRVIVNPDGTVESADEHENKYLDMNGLKPRVPILRPPIIKPDSEISEASVHYVAFPVLRFLTAIVTIGDSPAAVTGQAGESVNPLTPVHGVDSPVSTKPTPPDSATSKTILPPQYTALGVPITPVQTGNRFFRTNRVCETEIKKRGYVDRELRNTKSSGVTTTRRTRTTNTQRDSDTGSTSTSETKEGDAVKYMASVGVVSTPASKKKTSKSHGKQMVPASNVEHVPEEVEAPVDDGLNLTNEERKNILEFFNLARFEELCLMPGCFRKTAMTLVSSRPFQTITQLVNFLSETRLSSSLVDSCKEILQMRSTIIRLMQRCERITERVASHASKLLANSVTLSINPEQPDLDTAIASETGKNPDDVSGQLLTQQPAILNPLRELKPYQLVGLNWLRLLHHEQVNGILADEMGLGKTIQAIAFLASLWESGDRGPHLIICPSSTQDNWQRELADWCSHLKVLVYQGPAEQRKAMRLKIYEAGTRPDFNILLTSYAIGTSTIEDRALLKRVNFHYGIFDEAHMLKNMSSQRYRHLSNFRVQRRLLLTGTPLQNNLLELVSLLSFLMPDMFSRSAELLKRMFQVYSKPVGERGEDGFGDLKNTERSKFELERLEEAKNLLHPFFLRRLKSQVLSQLPPKTSEIIRVSMTESQAKHYWRLVERLRQTTASPSKNGTDVPFNPIKMELPGNDNCLVDTEPPSSKKLCLEKTVNGTDMTGAVDYSRTSGPTESPSNMIVQLRKAANHEALLSGIAFSEASLRDIAETLHLDPSHANSDPQLIFEDLSVLSDHQVHRIWKLAWLDENIPKLIKAGHRLLIFSQFVIVLDLLEEFLRSKDQRYLRLDGSTPVTERQELVDRFNSSSIEIFLLSTRAGGMGINLTGADVVIIHDIDFNPYNDKQAEDRVHRLGQTRPVHIIRLISENTVEEGILRIATDKLQLEQDVTGSVKQETDEAEPELTGASTVAEQEEDEFTESTNVVLKILGSCDQPRVKQEKPMAFLPRSTRISDREFWSLLEDTLKKTDV